MDFHDFNQQLYVTVAWFNYVDICNLCQTGKSTGTSIIKTPYVLYSKQHN